MVQKQRQDDIETEMRVAEKTNKAFVPDHPTAVVWPFWRTLHPYLIFVIFFTQAKFLENKIYTTAGRDGRDKFQVWME